MHGVKRERTTAEARAARKAKEAARLEAYLAVERRFFELRDASELSEAALEQTSKLLSLNPEFFTAWNYRRAILEHLFSAKAVAPNEGKASAEEVRTALLQDDLELTTHALRAHPKVYWIWSHRTWCLQNLPDSKGGGAKWKAELKLVEHMLDLDPRNFHGWDYRRHLLVQLAQASSDSVTPSSETAFPAALPVSLLKQELAYTLRKIESNFSNFSAWHQRSRCLPALWALEAASPAERARARDEEFELIRQAMYTDPADSSIWIYHRWLIDGELVDGELDTSGERGAPVLEREISGIEELLELEPDSKWCLESLAHYKTLQRAQLLATGLDPGEERAMRLTTTIQSMLARLKQVDPLRQARYEELQQAL